MREKRPSRDDKQGKGPRRGPGGGARRGGPSGDGPQRPGGPGGFARTGPRPKRGDPKQGAPVGRGERMAPGPWEAGPKRRNDRTRDERPAREAEAPRRPADDRPRRPGAKRAPEENRAPRPERDGRAHFTPGRSWGHDAPSRKTHTPRSDTENLVYGVRSVAALLKADHTRVARLFVEEGRSRQEDVAELVAAAQQHSIRVEHMSGTELAQLSRGAVHQGVLCEVAPFVFSEVSELLEADGPAMLLVLDEVTDPQNLGAAARAAWALGATGLILPKDRSATVTAAAEKVASGALAHLKVAQVTNLVRALEDLKKKGVWIMGLDVEGKEPIYGKDLTVPVALVVGSEHDGMRRLTKESCDSLVTIPMAHDGAALNAADAAAVALYEVARQRAVSV